MSIDTSGRGSAMLGGGGVGCQFIEDWKGIMVESSSGTERIRA